MIFDPELHAKRQEEFLIAILEHHEMKERPGAEEPNHVMLSLGEIAEKTSLSLTDLQRIGEELSRLRLIRYTGGGKLEEISYSLTPDGRFAAERIRYEKSPLARRRRAKAWAMQKGTEVAKIGAGKFLAGIGTIIVTCFGFANAESIAKAIRHLLGY